MTDRERLLKAILDNPEEDTPRLMFADEVEADQPHRAEFIRVGCELARTPETVEVVEDWPVEVVDGDTVRVSGGGFGAGFGADAAVTYALRGDTLTTTRRAVNPEYKRLCDRKNELLARHAYDWLPEIAGLDKFAIGRRGGAGSYFVGYLRKVMAPRGVLLPAPPPRLTTEFRRGFVERVTCSGDDWARRGDAILAAHPVRRVTLTTWPAFADNRYRQRGIPAVVRQNLRILWPRVEFVLPDPAPDIPDHPDYATVSVGPDVPIQFVPDEEDDREA